MPNYKLPLLKNVAITVFEKTKSFVVEAGKIILAISILLWVMATFGPGEQFNNAEEIVREQQAPNQLSEEALVDQNRFLQTRTFFYRNFRKKH